MPTLRPTGGTTYCTVETGIFSYTYDGSTSTGACFKKDQTCLSEWYWADPVNVTKFNIRSHYYYPNSYIAAIWGRVDGSWVMVWGYGVWMPAHATWDSKIISCNNCTGIRISQTHVPQPSRPCITEVTVEYTTPPPEGKATIVQIIKPDNFTPNVEFDIRPRMRNDGGEDIFFVRLTDRDTGNVLKETTRSTTLPSGGLWTSPMYITLTQTTDFHGRIEFGHIEIGAKVVDDTEDFTIPVYIPPPCSYYTDKTTCEAHGCWWWNGSCHDNQPTECSQLNNPDDCQRWGCAWWNNSCHGYNPSTCEELNNQTDCELYKCYWYNNSCHSSPQPPPECSDYTNQSTCEANNCHWWNGSCHDNPPTCSQLNNETDCERYGCYWYNGHCNDIPATCEAYNTQAECEAAGCYWYNNSCHSEPLLDLCAWIEAKGGPTALIIADIFEIVDAYLYETPPSGYTFVPTLQNVFGVIDYYLGFDGDAMTGCNFFP